MMIEMLMGLTESLFNLLLFIVFGIAGIFLITRSRKVVNFLAAKKQSASGKIIATIILGLFIMAASQFAKVVKDARVNVRDFIAIFACILAGPVVGIVVGLVGGIYTFYLGGWEAIPSGLATISAAVMGAYLWYKGYQIRTINTKQITTVILLTGIWEIIHTEVYIPLLGTKPFMEALRIMTENFVLPMVTINMLGIGMFVLLCKDVIEGRMREEKLEEEAVRWKKVVEALERYRKAKRKVVGK
jgi:LytS/YehU family sensor histidine kinase